MGTRSNRYKINTQVYHTKHSTTTPSYSYQYHEHGHHALHHPPVAAHAHPKVLEPYDLVDEIHHKAHAGIDLTTAAAAAVETEAKYRYSAKAQAGKQLPKR